MFCAYLICSTFCMLSTTNDNTENKWVFSGKWENIRKNFLIWNYICHHFNYFSFEHQICLGLCWIFLGNYSKCHHGPEISEWNNFRFWIFMSDVTKAHGQARSTSFGDNLPSVFRKWRYYCLHVSCEKYWVTWYWYTSNFEYFITLFQCQSYFVYNPVPVRALSTPAVCWHSGGVLFEDTWYSLVIQSNISSSRPSVDRPPYPYTRLSICGQASLSLHASTTRMRYCELEILANV